MAVRITDSPGCLGSARYVADWRLFPEIQLGIVSGAKLDHDRGLEEGRGEDPDFACQRSALLRSSICPEGIGLMDWSNGDRVTGSFQAARILVDENVEALRTHDQAAIWAPPS